MDRSHGAGGVARAWRLGRPRGEGKAGEEEDVRGDEEDDEEEDVDSTEVDGVSTTASSSGTAETSDSGSSEGSGSENEVILPGGGRGGWGRAVARGGRGRGKGRGAGGERFGRGRGLVRKRGGAVGELRRRGSEEEVEGAEGRESGGSRGRSESS